MGKKDGKKEGYDKDISPADSKWVDGYLQTKNDEVRFMCWVKKSKGKGAFEERLLVVCKYRLFTVTPKHKIAREGHFLDLTEINSPNDNEVTLTFKQWDINCQSAKVDDIITNIRISFEESFAGMPKEARFKLVVQPDSRVVDLPAAEGGICGGFNATYRSLCDYFAVPVKEDICWDITNLFPANNVTDFNLEEFEQPITPMDLSLCWQLFITTPTSLL